MNELAEFLSKLLSSSRLMAMTIEPEQTQASRPRAIPVDSFGNRLMLARAHAGHISIREAADLCEIGRGAWTNWEKGARPVDIIDVADVIADKLGVDRDWLLFGGGLSQQNAKPLRRRGRGQLDNCRNRTVNRPGPRQPKPPTPASPMAPQRLDPVRPMSAIPARRRRPMPVRPGGRPIAR